MLFQIANARQLRGLAGIRLGQLTQIPDNEPVWAETPEAMMTRWCGVLGIPYLGRAAIGHGPDNPVVPFGRG